MSGERRRIFKAALWKATAKTTPCVFFDDGKQVSLNLSDKTINFLQKHFINSNFIALKDGSTGLSGEAAVFVEGWYKDIVYNRGFAQSNIDKNAVISHNEHLVLKNSLTQDSEGIRDNEWLIFGAGENKAYQNGSANNGKISLAELMDKTLQSDKNHNGEITFLEAYAGEDKLAQGYENWLNAHLREYFGDENITINTHGIIAKRMGDEDANAVGFYDESIFESSLYGGLSGLTTNRFQSLKKELNPEVESSGSDKKNTKFSPQKEDEKEQKENSLAIKYPEFRALIERRGAENISEAELEQLRQKKQIAESYEANSISLEQEFSQAVFETNLSVWVFEGKFSFVINFSFIFSFEFVWSFGKFERKFTQIVRQDEVSRGDFKGCASERAGIEHIVHPREVCEASKVR